MGLTLGGFGDRRLEKGGPFWRAVCRKWVRRGFAFGFLGETVLGRSGYRDFCATMQ